MATSDNTVRVGTVSSVNASEKTARVIFPEAGDLVSGWLYVLQHPMSGTTGKTDGHTHSLSGGTWMPRVKDKVVCIMGSGEDSDGYIVGVIP